jgi:hypothetical protein
VWLAGRISATLVRVRHLNVVEGFSPSIVPATGLDSEATVSEETLASEGYLQSKDLQKDLFSIFCPSVFARLKTGRA